MRSPPNLAIAASCADIGSPFVALEPPPTPIGVDEEVVNGDLVGRRG